MTRYQTFKRLSVSPRWSCSVDSEPPLSSVDRPIGRPILPLGLQATPHPPDIAASRRAAGIGVPPLVEIGAPYRWSRLGGKRGVRRVSGLARRRATSPGSDGHRAQ